MRDGSQARGLLIRSEEAEIVIRVADLTMTIERSRIARIQFLPSVLERYQEMRAAIPDDDVEQLVLLAEWLMSVDRLDLALAELDALLARKPATSEAARLRTVVLGLIDLKRRSDPSKPASAPQPPRRPIRAEFPLLTPEQVTTIKVMEIDLEKPPRFRIPRTTIDRLLRDYASDPQIPATREARDAFYRARPEKVLDTMFRLKARELYPLVEVTDLPTSMRLFRDEVHQTWLMNSCATDRCHGGQDAGRLWLANLRAGSDPTVFTNFLILDRFRTKDGRALIDYDQPERSPLLHLAMEENRSIYPHPVVAGKSGLGNLYRPTFKNTDDRGFQRAAEWIRAMYRPRPEYPIDYQPPTPKPANDGAPEAVAPAETTNPGPPSPAGPPTPEPPRL